MVFTSDESELSWLKPQLGSSGCLFPPARKKNQLENFSIFSFNCTNYEFQPEFQIEQFKVTLFDSINQKRTFTELIFEQNLLPVDFCLQKYNTEVMLVCWEKFILDQKSNNLQYDTLVRWADSSTKCLTFQVFFSYFFL